MSYHCGNENSYFNCRSGAVTVMDDVYSLDIALITDCANAEIYAVKLWTK